jgi:hypothetical protein
MFAILLIIIMFILVVIILGNEDYGLMSPEEGEQWFENNFEIDKDRWIHRKH